jgi:hypothetical protein
MWADVVLVVHLAYAAFIVLGVAAILAGWAFGWRWVRNPWLRGVHVAALAIVAAEAVLGIACPLTVWESALRGGTSQPEAFIPRLASRLLYYDLPAWAFLVAYLAVLALIVALWVLVRPRPLRSAPRRATGRSG